jgi:hypothetical protein
VHARWLALRMQTDVWLRKRSHRKTMQNDERSLMHGNHTLNPAE